GVELMRELGEKDVRARVVIMTGAGDRIREAARRVGEEKGLDIAGTLDKPFTANRLLALIDDDPRRSGKASAAKKRADPRTVTIDELRMALVRDELTLRYQPKVDVRSRLVVGFEALLRWQHPDYGELLPDVFLPLALQSGLIDEITCRVLRAGARWVAAHELGVRPILCVNLSAPTLANLAIVETLHAICDEEGVTPDQVIFEITETAAAASPQDALAFLTRLRLRGFHAAIDDAGTGHSSLTQLARLPFSEMKLDKSFVQDIGRIPEAETIVASLVSLAHDLGLVVIAEGVENETAIDALIGMDCDFMHGYAIAAPMPGKEASDWYARRKHPDPTVSLFDSPA
ncbi:MAG: EAL domain-containing response regulator, partial [Proteobacteria bacterium]|nr:EAL domain-containing response regulator [Pseudomonadota bacterium]